MKETTIAKKNIVLDIWSINYQLFYTFNLPQVTGNYYRKTVNTEHVFPRTLRDVRERWLVICIYEFHYLIVLLTITLKHTYNTVSQLCWKSTFINNEYLLIRKNKENKTNIYLQTIT